VGPASVLNDPVVGTAAPIAARRVHPNIEPPITAVEKAVMEFRVAPLFGAVAMYRAALAAYPNERIANRYSEIDLPVMATGGSTAESTRCQASP
jgi:hypothetical protein